MDSGGFLVAILFILALIPFSAGFLVKCVRAQFSDPVKADFARRPGLHALWGLATLFCCYQVGSWVLAYINRR